MKILILLSLLLNISLFAQEEHEHSKRELVRLSLAKLDAKEELGEVVDKWNALFDEQNLRRDRYKERNNWKESFPILQSYTQRIEGKRVYYNLFKKRYHYTIHSDAENNELVVELKLHFYPSKTYQRKMAMLHRTNHPDRKYYPQLEELDREVAKNVKLSEKIWNAQAPEGVRFRFIKVDDASEADYSLKLVTMPGALYDRFIMAPAPDYILAHEMGHMLGLDDEYALITSNVLPVNSLIDMMKAKHKQRGFERTGYQDMRCNLESLMCLREKIYPYHFDHILGRMKL